MPAQHSPVTAVFPPAHPSEHVRRRAHRRRYQGLPFHGGAVCMTHGAPGKNKSYRRSGAPLGSPQTRPSRRMAPDAESKCSRWRRVCSADSASKYGHDSDHARRIHASADHRQGLPAAVTHVGETVCVAGVRVDTDVPTWIRLYPVQYRELGFADRFSKYQIMDLRAFRSPSDQRPKAINPTSLPPRSVPQLAPTTARGGDDGHTSRASPGPPRPANCLRFKTAPTVGH